MTRFSAWGQWGLVTLLVLGAAAPCARANATYSSVILADMPIAYYRLGESITTPVALETTGSGRDGIYTRSVKNGVPGAIVGDPDTACAFDGMTTSVVIPYIGTDPLNLSSSFTLEAWVINQGQGTLNPNRSPLGRIVSNGWPGNIGYGFGILDPGRGEFLRFTTYGVEDYDSAVALVPEDGNWHYVAVVFDASFSANFYVDGVFQDTVTGGAGARPAALDIVIGRNPASGAEEFFNGSIDEVAIYDHELSASDITRHYMTGIAP